MKYRLIVFDWDGTIIDSAATIAECIRDSARDMRLPVPSTEQASHVIGLGLHDSLRMAVPELQPHQYPEFVANYRRHFLAREDSMGLFSGMKELLKDLKTKHLLAIATGKMNPTSAFMQGKIKVKGDMSLAMKLQTLLA